MRIAVIRKECTYFKGGAERYCADLCHMLAEMGHKVYVLARECDTNTHPSIIHIPIKVHNLTSSIRNLSFHLNSQRALRNLQVDMVYALSRTYPADAFRVSDPLHIFWMDMRYTKRIEKFFQKLNPRHRTILKLEKRIFNPQFTRIIITNSKLAKNQVSSLYHFPEDRIHVVNNGVDLIKYSPDEKKSTKKKEPLHLLFVGHDFKRKGLNHLIDALSKLKQSSISCWLQVVGKGNSQPYKRQAAHLGIEDWVCFTGPSKSVEDFYRAADLMVLPTQYDPFANVCLEAMASGLPVVTTTNNGAAEIIDEGRMGYILNGIESLPEQIAETVKRFSKVSSLERNRMKQYARERAKKYTVVQNVQKTIELLKTI